MKKYQIEKIKAREVIDSRGNPTVEVDVFTPSGISRSIVPSGASTGKHEALELRDNDIKRFHGLGVLKAVDNINKIIAPKLIGDDCVRQKAIDEVLLELDGTSNKSKLGANAILAVSMGICKAAAHYLQVPLHQYIGSLSNTKANIMPIPQLNIINGGKHAGIDNDIQEHMIVPNKFKNFKDSLRAGIEVYSELKKLLKKEFGAQGSLIGDEGGFVPKIEKIEQRLDLINSAISNAGYSSKISLAMDCAASEFFNNGIYKINNKGFSSDKLVDFYENLIRNYDIISIEDGMAEDDWDGWKKLTESLGKKIQIIGDDLLVTNKMRIEKAIKLEACNSLLLKVNQIGTITEAIDAFSLAKKSKWNVIVSHRSGESEDTFIADFVVGLNAGFCKFGAPARSDRNAKYNQLLRIEEELGKGSIKEN